ncbi:hypothetical protein HAHE_16000 [Haloferula helveola]|uniref:Uncharacterized protein n=2 Tax=Haloferula helveola TaxID=490095 RepID=A0ABM7RDG7_9BACT|nr:hypothetical protein HAHE_16000 [Haloferula helveola]
MNDTMNTEPTTPTATSCTDKWKARILPGLSYAIAIGLTLAGPALMACALVLAVLAGSASVAGLGLLAGAVLGAAGAVSLLWCLSKSNGTATA